MFCSSKVPAFRVERRYSLEAAKVSRKDRPKFARAAYLRTIRGILSDLSNVRGISFNTSQRASNYSTHQAN